MSGQERQKSSLKLLISKGKEQGYLTYAEVNDHLPDTIVDPEQIEDVVSMINDMGIKVFEKAPDDDSLLLNDDAAESVDADEEAAEAAAAALSSVDSDFGRTTDPVRMYMREMGTVELLTREGEIQIAIRIEEGLYEVLTSLADFPASTEYLSLQLLFLHRKQRKRIRMKTRLLMTIRWTLMVTMPKTKKKRLLIPDLIRKKPASNSLSCVSFMRLQ